MAAIVVVHIFGNMANMEMIMDIAQKYKLKVIEDATEALGSHYSEGRFSGMYAGTIGDYGAYSFNGNKIITTGGGGAVTAKNSEQVHHMKYLSTQAKDDAQFYVHNEIGYNYRMTNLQAALGVAQLEKLPEYIQRKQNNYQRYKELFDGFELCSLLEFEKGIFSNKWFYSIQINRKYIQTDLEKILAMLMERGVQTRTIWGLICEQKPYRNDITYEIEKAFRYSKCILNIPCSTNITEDEIKKVAETIKNVLEQLVK